MHCGIRLTFAGGEKANHLCRGTLIWEWEDDRWKLAHEVFSAPVGPRDSVFQANRPEDPRIKPDLELMDRARQVASAWGNGSTRGLAKRLKEFYVDDDKLSIYTPWHPFIAYQGWQAFEHGLKRYIAASIKHVDIKINNDFNDFDRIYVMDTHNYASIISLARNQNERDKVDLILNEINPKSFDSVPDPYYGEGDGFQIVYDLIDEACEKIYSEI